MTTQTHEHMCSLKAIFLVFPVKQLEMADKTAALLDA